MLFTERSIWSMIHGIGLAGGFLLLFSSAFHCLWSLRAGDGLSATFLQRQCRTLAGVTLLMAVILWATILIGTFIAFPGYRAAPPAGTADLTLYPKELLKSSPDTEWLHAIGMETKEHMPWIAGILMTAVAFVAVRYQARLTQDNGIRRTMLAFLTITLAVVSVIAMLGIFINKVAPLV
jgi:hypothetical protein